jgi:hypothetical protein
MLAMSAVRGVILSTVLVAACGDGGGFPDAPPIDMPPPAGTFNLAWTVKDIGGNVLPCDQIGAQTVTVLTRNRAVQGGSTEVFTCSTLMGSSQGLTPGTYDMDFELGGLGGAVGTGIIATSPKQMGIVIQSGENVTLMPLAFAVDATGGIKINVTANKPGGNCGSVATNGAGITGMTLTLNHTSGGACEPVTFTIAPNATLPGGSYTVNCASPTVAPCIEADQQLSVTGVKSDGYQLHVRGKVATADCWTNDDTMPVPPLGRDVIRTLNLAAATSGTPGC